MPIYEYICRDCETRFDTLRPMSQADAPIACQACGSEHTTRAISMFFAQSDGRSVAGSRGSSCSSCSSGTCSTCGS